MNIYIASDFHLSFEPITETEKRRNALVLGFISSIKDKADMLILAGDIFDLWYDWKKVMIKGYFPFLKKLADLEENGCRLVFVAGNHDFWFGDFLSKYLNFEVYNKYFSDIIDGKKLFAAHGDIYTSNDLRYRIFHYMIRHRITRFFFSSLHPNNALSLGMLASRTSRSKNAGQNKEEMQRLCGLQKYAEKIAPNYDIIVMGHSHKPLHKQIKKAAFLNCGYWGEDNSYVVIKDGQPQLVSFQ